MNRLCGVIEWGECDSLAPLTFTLDGPEIRKRVCRSPLGLGRSNHLFVILAIGGNRHAGQRVGSQLQEGL